MGIWGHRPRNGTTGEIAGYDGPRPSRRGVGPRGDAYSVPGTGDPQGTLPDRVFIVGQELEFLAGLDFLILAMPLTPSTKAIVGERELRALKPTAFLLNPARGPLIHEGALLQALREGWITGAVLDTHFHYPMPVDHPLWHMPNVIMTPHISGSDRGPHFLNRFWEIVTHNVANYLAAKPLWNELTADELNGDA